MMAGWATKLELRPSNMTMEKLAHEVVAVQKTPTMLNRVRRQTELQQRDPER